MATRGRKPKPTNVKLIQGTARVSRLNPKEPKPQPVRLEPPAFLNAYAKEEWNRVVDQLYNLGITSHLDLAVLAAYCQSFGRWREAEESLARFAAKDKATHGIMMKTQAGNAIQNPLVGAANKAHSDVVRYAADLGMTPSARSRVSGAEKKDPNDPAARFFGE